MLYIEEPNEFYIAEMLCMAKERASRGAKLSLVGIVCLSEHVPGKEVFKLREHVTRVGYMVDDVPPYWDSHHGEIFDSSYENE